LSALSSLTSVWEFKKKNNGVEAKEKIH
jgi:hypothetical protein